ncbi:MAG: hypothetical protein PF636_09805 [Actinomycetota bacterium]|jgi:tetratricopeptide (TPR) repeat protein|nr:hypothetical protein [Actinomycetota bacterium]
MTEETVIDTAVPQEPDSDDLVPTWLAVLVLVLLLAVVGFGGYLVRGLFSDDTVTTPQSIEIDRWEEAVRLDPADEAANLALGFAYQQDGQYDLALDHYDVVLRSSPLDMAANYNKGIVLLELGIDDAAEESLWNVLEANETHALAAKALGEYYATLGHYQSLIAAVRPAVVEHPEMADLQYLMGLAYENTDHPDWAEARYRYALEYYPDMQEARDGLERLGVQP